MKKIRDMTQILGLLENGEFNPAVSKEAQKTLNDLYEMAETSPGRTFKGSTTIELNFEVKDGTVIVRSDFKSKVPKRPRKVSMFWIVDEGALSTEHPKQHDMFSLREADRA